MRDYKNWTHFAEVMNTKRAAASGELGKLKTTMTDLQAKATAEVSTDKREAMAKQLIEMKRQFEDKELTARTALDQESAGYLRTMFGQLQVCVKAIADQQGFDIIMAYPDALTKEELSSPLYYDLKLRPPAAMPFYISPTADVTQVLVDTLNMNFKPPAGAAGAGAPATGAPAATPK